MLCNNILKLIIIFIIYIEKSINVFIIYIGIIGLKSHFDCTNFRASSIIKIINFKEIKKMAHFTMLVIFYVDVISCQKFNLPHIYCIFAEKNHFLKWKISN
jgi:hypothetical protein